MSSLNKTHQKKLEKMFGERVTFDKTERKLYGHDIAAMPSLIKPLIGDTTPDAVVQPSSEAELVELVRWANANDIPLTPRGKATSGYGGVLPVKNGIVVDFYRMKNVLAVDDEKPDRHRPARHRLGEAGQRAREAGPHPAALSDQLPVLHRRRLAGPGRRRHRLLRVRLVRGQRGQRARSCCPTARCGSSPATTWI